MGQAQHYIFFTTWVFCSIIGESWNTQNLRGKIEKFVTTSKQVTFTKLGESVATFYFSKNLNTSTGIYFWFAQIWHNIHNFQPVHIFHHTTMHNSPCTLSKSSHMLSMKRWIVEKVQIFTITKALGTLNLLFVTKKQFVQSNFVLWPFWFNSNSNELNHKKNKNSNFFSWKKREFESTLETELLFCGLFEVVHAEFKRSDANVCRGGRYAHITMACRARSLSCRCAAIS